MIELVFCLNPDTASSNACQTWVCVRFNEETSVLERRTNDTETAGGQRWVPFGYTCVSDGVKLVNLFATNPDESFQSRVMATVIRRTGRECNVLGFGAAWSGATWNRVTVDTQAPLNRKARRQPVRAGYRLDSNGNVREVDREGYFDPRTGNLRKPSKDAQALRRLRAVKSLTVEEMRARLLARK